MAKVTAYVYVNSGGTASIWPPVLIATKNDQTEIVNLTEKDIFVIYPEEVFDDGQGNNNKDPDKTGRSAKKGKKAERKVAKNPDPGIHRFKVFSYETQSFAVANSDPEFIIEP